MIRETPPIGVIIPKVVIFVIDSKYKDPEKITVPTIIKIAGTSKLEFLIIILKIPIKINPSE